MAVQLCTLVDVRDPADHASYVTVVPQTPFTDGNSVSHSGPTTFNYVSNALPGSAQVVRSDSAGNSPAPAYYVIRRVMGSGTQTWANVLLDADTVNLNDLTQVPGGGPTVVPIVTRALLNGVEVDPDAEGVLNLGNLSTTTALSAETSRATAAEAANATAITSEASTARANEALKLAKASNLSDLANAGTARTNLGLGDAATHPASDFGPVVGSDNWLKAWAANIDNLIRATTITRDANEAATAATVVWPDGSPGTYAATTVSTSFPGAVDAYTVTYGSPVTKTVTQPAVTRDSAGAVTVRPALTVA